MTAAERRPKMSVTVFYKHEVIARGEPGEFAGALRELEPLARSSDLLAFDDETGKQAELQVGSEHEFKIVKMSPEEKKVGLSLRGIGEEASREEVESYKTPSSSSSSSSSSSTTLGDLINWKRSERE